MPARALTDTICSLPLSGRLTRLLLDDGLVDLGEVSALSLAEMRQAGLSRKARVELARALLIHKAACRKKRLGSVSD